MALGLVCLWKTQQCALFQPIYSSYGAFFGHSRVNNLSNPTHREKYVSLSNKRWWLCCPTLTPKKKLFLASLTTSTQGPHRASSTAAFTVYFGNRSSANKNLYSWEWGQTRRSSEPTPFTSLYYRQLHGRYQSIRVRTTRLYSGFSPRVVRFCCILLDPGADPSPHTASGWTTNFSIRHNNSKNTT